MRRHCLRISEAHHKPNRTIETSAHSAHTLICSIFIYWLVYRRGGDFADVRAMPHKGHGAKIRSIFVMTKEKGRKNEEKGEKNRTAEIEIYGQ